MRLGRMARYFFHIFNDEIVVDEEGIELPTVEAVREHALEGARSLVCESVKKGHLNLDHRIEVTDAKNVSVLTLTFREAFTLD